MREGEEMKRGKKRRETALAVNEVSGTPKEFGIALRWVEQLEGGHVVGHMGEVAAHHPGRHASEGVPKGLVLDPAGRKPGWAACHSPSIHIHPPPPEAEEEELALCTLCGPKVGPYRRGEVPGNPGLWEKGSLDDCRRTGGPARKRRLAEPPFEN